MQQYEFEPTEAGLRLEGFPHAVKFVRLDEKIARRLADLRLHMHDLELAFQCLERITTHRPDAHVVVQALWRTAVIHYVKCYGASDGRPSNLNRESVYKGDTQAQDHHNYFVDLRNKHIVHDENPLGQCITAAVLNDSNAARKIEQVVCVTAMVETLTETHYTNLRLLIEISQKWVVDQFEQCSASVMRDLECEPYEDLARRDEVMLKVPTQDDVRSKKR